MEHTDYRAVNMQWLPKAKSKKNTVKKIFKTVLFVLISILVFLSAYFPLTYRWARTTWSDLTIQEIVYHLMMPAEGAAGGMVTQHILKCLVPAIVITGVFVVLVIVIRRYKTAAAFVKGAAAAVAGVIVINTVATFWTEMNVTEYMDSQSTYSSFIDSNYVDPASVDLTFPEEKRNLIYILLESTENTFADESVGGGFSENVIPELTQLSLENENFSGGNTQLNGGIPMNGATWTMGAMFAQTSGLPLSIQVGGNEMSAQEEFFPSATVLGDILEEEGYNQTLLLGSDATFGGRKLYFTTHGNYTMRDYYYYTGNGTLPSDYKVWWGYEDMYLYENAKTELEELSSQDAPFNLTMLTVDTHFEDGYVCSLCRDDTDDQYSNVYRCASRQLSEFIDWCREQDWYENTTIVVSGDHLTMDADFCENVDGDYQRKVYTTIINGAAKPQEEKYREYTTMDMFPTTLAALGVQIPGDRLGLGTNLYSGSDTLLEIYGYDELYSGLSSKSELMDNLTAGITTPTCDIEVLDYDKNTNTIQLIVSNISGVGADNIQSVTAKVYEEGNQSNEASYTAEDRGDGSFIITIYFSDLDYRSGTYNVTITAREAGAVNGNIFTTGATTIYMSVDEENAGAIENTSSLGYTIGDFDYSSGSFEITYGRLDMQDLAGVQFAVWKQDDQSDLQWISAELGPDGIYRASVNVFDYAFDDSSFTIDLYELRTDGTSKMIRRDYYSID